MDIGLWTIHGNNTQTSSSALKFADSFTRASVVRPNSTWRESAILPIGIPAGKIPPSAAGDHGLAGINFALLFEINPSSTSELSNGPSLPITPGLVRLHDLRRHLAIHDRQCRTTVERVRPTEETRPTRPSMVSTGRFCSGRRGCRGRSAPCATNWPGRAERLAELEFPRFASVASRTADGAAAFSRAVSCVCSICNLQLLVFAPQIFVLPEQLRARRDGIAGLIGQLICANSPTRRAAGTSCRRRV